MFDIGSGEMTEEIAAHDAEVWSLVISPDSRNLGSSYLFCIFLNYLSFGGGIYQYKRLKVGTRI